MGFPGGSVVKNQPSNAEEVALTPGSGRSPEEGNGNPLQYSCMENPMDRGAWRTTVHGVTKNQTQLSNWALYYVCIYTSEPPGKHIYLHKWASWKHCWPRLFSTLPFPWTALMKCSSVPVARSHSIDLCMCVYVCILYIYTHNTYIHIIHNIHNTYNTYI